MPEPKFMYNCDLCGSSFQFGPHIYAGKVIPSYKLTVCRTCWESNHDGWGPLVEDRFVANLQSKGIPLPERNKGGWYPRE